MLNALGPEVAKLRAQELRDRAAAERRRPTEPRRRPRTRIGHGLGVALIRAGARLAHEEVSVG